MNARLVVALLSGVLFGCGLVVSGMTDTARVQGFLDPFGRWDPTLAFVMGGALLPMFVAWRLAASRGRALLGGAVPAAPSHRIDRRLVAGAGLFGAGWGLVGFCPGPALAALGLLDWRAAVFVLAMALGMWLSELPPLASRPTLGSVSN